MEEEYKEFDLDEMKIAWLGERIGYSGGLPIEIVVENDAFSLYHCFLNATFVPYRTEFMYSEKVKQEELVDTLGRSLAFSLDKPSEEKNLDSYYNVLHNKGLSDLAFCVRKYTLDGFREELMKKEAGLGSGEPEKVVIEYLSRLTHFAIFVLDSHREDVYLLNYEDRMITEKSAIVLKYNRGSPDYYTTVALLPANTTEINEDTISRARSIFPTSHPFIQALYSRTKQIHEEWSQIDC